MRTKLVQIRVLVRKSTPPPSLCNVYLNKISARISFHGTLILNKLKFRKGSRRKTILRNCALLTVLWLRCPIVSRKLIILILIFRVLPSRNWARPCSLSVSSSSLQNFYDTRRACRRCSRSTSSATKSTRKPPRRSKWEITRQTWTDPSSCCAGK